MKNTITARARILALCILVLLLSAVFTFVSYATEPVRNTIVSIVVEHNEIPIEGIEYSVYKIAEPDSKGKYIISDDFRNANISLENMSAETLRLLGNTLKGYIAANGVKPEVTGITGTDGNIRFKEPLTPALYFILGSTIHYGNEYIIPTPLVVELPMKSGTDGEYYEEVRLVPKYSAEPDDELKEIEVLKVWKLNGEKLEAQNIEIELYKGPELFDSVTLSQDNNWQYLWENLKGADWSVYEKSSPVGFTVTVDIQGDRFVITNTSTEREEPSTDDEASTDSAETTSPAETTTNRDETTTVPGEVTTAPDDGEFTAASDESTTGNASEKPVLPNTGQLWWPIILMSFLGVIFILFGMINRRYEEEI